MRFGDSDGAKVAWWVNGSAVAGYSKVGAPYTHDDPDQNFKKDGCDRADSDVDDTPPQSPA